MNLILILNIIKYVKCNLQLAEKLLRVIHYFLSLKILLLIQKNCQRECAEHCAEDAKTKDNVEEPNPESKAKELQKETVDENRDVETVIEHEGDSEASENYKKERDVFLSNLSPEDLFQIGKECKINTKIRKIPLLGNVR